MSKTEVSDKVVTGMRRSKQDTGSPEVQVAMLTKRIQELTGHLKTHKKDNHSRRGLLQMVGKRKRLLQYLQSQDSDTYQKVIDQLGIRR